MSKLIINTDGGSRGNPGQAASAWTIRDNQDQLLDQGGVFLGLATNNEAEYLAVKHALQILINKFSPMIPMEIEIRADSTLVVNQLAGKFKIKNPRLKILIEEIKQLERQLGKITYHYIPRAENYEADRLVNEVLDKNS